MDTLKIQKVILRPNCTSQQLLEFESKFSIRIPVEYRVLLLNSNGLKFEPPFFYFSISSTEKDQISEFNSIEGIDFDINMLKEDIEEGSNTYFYTDCLLPIAGTQYSGAWVFIGYKEPYLNKIYYADYDVVDENNVPILIKLADSLEDFFAAHGYYEK